MLLSHSVNFVAKSDTSTTKSQNIVLHLRWYLKRWVCADIKSDDQQNVANIYNNIALIYIQHLGSYRCTHEVVSKSAFSF